MFAREALSSPVSFAERRHPKGRGNGSISRETGLKQHQCGSEKPACPGKPWIMVLLGPKEWVLS